jgi:hypothetical protein
MKLTKIQYLNEFDVMLCFESVLPADTKIYINNVLVENQAIYQNPDHYVLESGEANFGVLGWSFSGTSFTFGNSFEVKNSAETLVVSDYGNGFYTDNNGDIIYY